MNPTRSSQRNKNHFLIFSAVDGCNKESCCFCTPHGYYRTSREDPQCPRKGTDLPLHGLLSGKTAARQRTWRGPDL